ncbi:MAG: DUF1015 domain-containing protein [Acidimicrobiales bacterium]
MPRFEPFPAVRYSATAGEPAALIAPPYDVIGPDERAALEARSSVNAVRLELPSDGHAGAAARFRAWMADGTLVGDSEPAFYVYRMTAGGRATTGVLGALELEAPGAGILPHERTTAKDKSDRLGILRTTEVNLSPIWALSAAHGRLAAAARPDGLEPLASAVDDEGVLHELWRLDDPRRMAEVTAAVAAQPVLIADGHHRFEVANEYRAEAGAASGAGAILAYLVELAEEELAVHPIHRLLSDVPADLALPADLTPWFQITPAAVDDAEQLPAAMAEEGALGLVLPSGLWLARPRATTTAAADDDLDSCRLDVALVGLAGLGKAVTVSFQHGAGIVADAVRKGEADAAVLLRPATIGQIAATGAGGERMPPKTTFFWPKPRTGLVFRDLAQAMVTDSSR